MYYSNYNPFFNPNYYFRRSTPNIVNEEKKDTETHESDTISFQDFYPNNIPNSNFSNSDEKTTESSSKSKNRFFSFDKEKINIFGFELEIDDLIILALIFLLLLDSTDNLMLIIVLGLILLNVNLSDILNLF